MFAAFSGNILYASRKFSLKVMMLSTVCFALSGCAGNLNSIYRSNEVNPDVSTVTAVDTKQRFLLASPGKDKLLKFCSEPSPDVFSVYAQSLGLNAGATEKGGTTPAEMKANFAAAIAEQGAVIQRTQTVNLLRESMFRTCERYMSGALTDAEISIQTIRDQRMAVAVLAIEQLTPREAFAPVTIGTGSTGTSSPTNTSTSATPSAPSPAPAPAQPLQTAHLEKVASTVKEITEMVFKQDEFLLFCMSKIKDQNDALKPSCEKYLEQTVLKAAAYSEIEINTVRQGIQKERDENFNSFFEKIKDTKSSEKIDSTKLKAVLKKLTDLLGTSSDAAEPLLAPMRSVTTKSEIQPLFKKLDPYYRRILAQ